MAAALEGACAPMSELLVEVGLRLPIKRKLQVA
jgi:hypothetical protein